ncbi:rhodanese-like domain-containing protein [Flavobacterium humi]|uniref:Redoxin domain-containing protein n=1 Tax=Flavobacterium humi TaxID=2562683 RepID=A0A4Z0L8N6_9FLAO|nr:rhodanese-like domain-containing protein [Flavobacterium humi]TGD57975.1 redoxin domain-containing protein [Flavobacterium humi]
MKTFILQFFSLCLLFASCQGQNAETVQTIEAKDFAEKLKSSDHPQLLDVRTPEEYTAEHIENAANVNWNGDDFAAKAEKYDKTKPVFVYCKVGGRSAQAAHKLQELGFTKVYNLDGGIMKWNASGLSAPSDKIIGMCSQEFDELLQSDKKIMIDFYAEWCAPCKKMTPYITKMQEDLKGKMTIVRLDADKNKTLVNSLKLDGLPVIIMYENGKETWRNTGYISEEDLKKHL